MLASNIHVMNEVTGVTIQTVAGGGVAMSYQDALTCVAGLHVGLDQIAATADIGRYFCRQVPHSGMKHVALAGAVETVGIHYETLTKAVVERQHLVFPCFFPPELHQRCELFGLLCR